MPIINGILQDKYTIAHNSTMIRQNLDLNKIYSILEEGCKTVLITGPSASGKSRLACNIASSYNGIVVNADALQVYSCWRILTAQPTSKETAYVPHRLYGHVSYTTRYSIGSWISDITKLKHDLHNRLHIFVGGTGLYLSTLTKGLAPIPPINPNIEHECLERYKKSGLDGLLEDIAKLDGETFNQLDTMNPSRVQRAWNVLYSTGRGMASWHKENSEPIVDIDNSLAIVLDIEPGILNKRISQRLESMVKDGVLSECERLMHVWNPKLPASKALGAQEFICYLQGKISLEVALEKAALVTRQYAKRQRTWFRNKMGNWIWINQIKMKSH